MRPLSVLLAGTAFLLGAVLVGPRQSGQAASSRSFEGEYPYGSPTFTRFVQDSYQDGGLGSGNEFYEWFEGAYSACNDKDADRPALGLREVLDENRRALAVIADRSQHAREEERLGAWLHRMVKATIPRFSLERGFEFRNAARRGERQCFLQSVLIAGLLQAMGMDAGVAMVSRNHNGLPTNNGHAATVLHLADGTDRIVDASEKTPFARQMGLFLCDPQGYCYVTPAYPGSEVSIPSYQRLRARDSVTPNIIRPLDVAFLRSQFDYYRGERTPGGIMGTPPTPAGLAKSAEYFRRSIKLCPGNPLAVYQLGRVLLRQGKIPEARRQFTAAVRLYQQAGWVPDGPRSALENAGQGAIRRGDVASGDAPAAARLRIAHPPTGRHLTE